MKTLLTSIIFLLIFSISISAQDSLKYYGEEYFPLSENRTLIFDSDFGETKSYVSFDKGVWTLTNESDDFKYVQKILKKDDGIFLLETDQYATVLLIISIENQIKYNEAALNVPIPLYEGQKWEWRGFQIKDEDTSKVEILGEVLGEENIEIPAGKFNALKIQMQANVEEGSNSTVTQWVVKELGVIKIRAKIEGGGIANFLSSVLGYDEINFELKEIQYNQEVLDDNSNSIDEQ